jgi:hypothetical protein
MTQARGHYPISGSDLRIEAYPTAQLGTFENGLILVLQGVLGDSDADITPGFRNVFPGAELVASAAVAHTTTMKHPSANPTNVSFVTRSHQTIADKLDCANNLALLQSAIGLPSTFDIGDTTLAETDDTDVSIDRAHDVVATWTVVTGSIDFYSVVLMEVVPDSTNTTSFVGLREIHSTVAHVRLDPSLLVADHYYILRITGYLGYARAASGNFAETKYPNEDVVAVSPMFHVVN